MACRFEVMLSSDDARDMAAARRGARRGRRSRGAAHGLPRRQRRVGPEPPGRARRVTVGATVFGLLDAQRRAAHADRRRVRRDVDAAQPLLGISCSARGASRPTRRSRTRRARRRHGARAASTRRSAACASRATASSSTSARIAKGFALDRMASCCAAAARARRCSRPDTAACWRSAARGAAGRSICVAAAGEPPRRAAVDQERRGRHQRRRRGLRGNRRPALRPRRSIRAPAVRRGRARGERDHRRRRDRRRALDRVPHRRSGPGARLLRGAPERPRGPGPRRTGEPHGSVFGRYSGATLEMLTVHDLHQSR